MLCPGATVRREWVREGETFPSILPLYPSQDGTVGSVAFYQVLQLPFQMDAKYLVSVGCLAILSRTVVEMKQGKAGCEKQRKMERVKIKG